MDNRTNDAMIREHYRQHALADDRVSELVALIHEGAAAAGTRPGPRRSWWASRIAIGVTAAAASVAIALTLVFLYERPGRALFTKPTTAAATSPDTSSPAAGLPRIVAVKFHADWCRPSQTISPVVDELRQRYGDDGVLFVEVDLTTEQTRAQAIYLMSALGLDEIWKQQRGRTGELLLVDRRDSRVLSTFNHDHDVQAMAAALTRALDPT